MFGYGSFNLLISKMRQDQPRWLSKSPLAMPLYNCVVSLVEIFYCKNRSVIFSTKYYSTNSNLLFSQSKGLQNEGNGITLNHLENLFWIMAFPTVHSSEVHLIWCHIIQEYVCPNPLPSSSVAHCTLLRQARYSFMPQLPSVKQWIMLWLQGTPFPSCK